MKETNALNKIIVLAALNENGYTQKVNHAPMSYKQDDEPLLSRVEAQQRLPLHEDAYYVMDMHTYEYMKDVIATEKIILWGITADDHQKHYSNKLCYKTSISLQELRLLEKNVYCVGIKQSFLLLFSQHADEMITIRFLGNKEEWSKEETLPERNLNLVWDLESLDEQENYQVEHTVRTESWIEDVKNAKVLFKQVLTKPEKLIDKKNDILRCFTLMYASYFSYYAIIQHLLGDQFAEVYKSYESAIPTEYLEYATTPSFKLSGESQRQKIFTDIFIEWYNKAFCSKTISRKEFTLTVERIYEKQHPADILYGDTRKDLSYSEIERIVEKVFCTMGCTPEKEKASV